MTIRDLRAGLREFVLADAAIAAVVSARMYPLILPQGVKQTSIVYSRISGLGDHHTEGPSGLNRPRYQIDCWSTSIDTASALADLVKGRIDGFRGTMGSGSNAIEVQGVFFDGEREGYDDDAKMFRVSRDYFIWYAER